MTYPNTCGYNVHLVIFGQRQNVFGPFVFYKDAVAWAKDAAKRQANKNLGENSCLEIVKVIPIIAHGKNFKGKVFFAEQFKKTIEIKG